MLTLILRSRDTEVEVGAQEFGAQEFGAQEFRDQKLRVKNLNVKDEKVRSKDPVQSAYHEFLAYETRTLARG